MTHSRPKSTAELSAVALAEQFAELARSLAAQPSEEAAWKAIVQGALQSIDGTEDADITVMRGSNFRTVAPSSDRAARVDEIQYNLRSGPCVDAILEQAIFRTGDLAQDQRWPEFGSRAARQEGVNSVLAFRLFLEDDQTIGGLNLYSTQKDAFDESATVVGSVFATHAAIALATTQSRNDVQNLEVALKTNREIGIAIGILMSRFHVTHQQGFDLLRMASQHTHRKLHDLAAEVAETGTLDFPPP